MLYVIYLCEDTTEASPPDDPHYYSEILVACLSILGLTLIVILVICLKRRSYGEWKSMDIPLLGTWYYAHCWSYRCCGGTRCHPLYCIPSTLLIYRRCDSVNIAVKCIVMKCLFWWALGHHDENVHGDMEWWKRACQLYM